MIVSALNDVKDGVKVFGAVSEWAYRVIGIAVKDLAKARDAAVTRLESIESTAVRGLADGTAGVCAETSKSLIAGDHRSAAGRGATRDVLLVSRVAHDSSILPVKTI